LVDLRQISPQTVKQLPSFVVRYTEQPKHYVSLPVLSAQINSPADLKKLDQAQLSSLPGVEAIHHDNVSIYGHFGASLGVAEPLWPHYVFNAPYDLIVWM
jgi:hypothetical protein